MAEATGLNPVQRGFNPRRQQCRSSARALRSGNSIARSPPTPSRSVVKIAVTSTDNREVAGSNPARCFHAPVAQWPERYPACRASCRPGSQHRLFPDRVIFVPTAGGEERCYFGVGGSNCAVTELVGHPKLATCGTAAGAVVVVAFVGGTATVVGVGGAIVVEFVALTRGRLSDAVAADQIQRRITAASARRCRDVAGFRLPIASGAACTYGNHGSP